MRNSTTGGTPCPDSLSLSLSLSLISSVARADAGTIASCYATAESENPGLNIAVRLGTTTQLQSSDLDAVFDKIAELHTDPTLNVVYNTAGRYAMKSAMDCIFDAGHYTVSAIWANENDSQLAVRNYTGVVVENGTPTGELEFELLETAGADTFIRFQPVQGQWECARAQVTAIGANDFLGLITATHVLCFNPECGGRCEFYTETNTCECGIPQSCTTIWKGGQPGNGMIVKWVDPS